MFSTLPKIMKDSFHIVRKNKLVVLLLMTLHLVFIAGLGVMTFMYVVTLTTSYQAIGEQLALTTQSAQDLEKYAQGFDVEGTNDPRDAVEAGETIKNAKQGLEEARKKMTQGTMKLLALLGLFYILIAGVSWSLTHKILRKKSFSESWTYFKKFIAVALPSTIIVLSIVYYVSTEANKQLFLNKPANEYVAGTLFILLLITLYLMYFFYTHLGKKIDGTWVHKTIMKSVKKFPYSMAVLVISLILVFIPYAIVDWTMDSDFHPLLVILSFILAPLFIVYARIFYYNALHNL